MLSRKHFWSWLPLSLFALVLLLPLRPIVLGRVQRGLLATDLWQVEISASAAAMPVVLTGGDTYPHNLPLVTLDSKKLKTSKLKGKSLFVNLWASWCTPCRAEMPGIEVLYRLSS